jgi:hypothetical protein
MTDAARMARLLARIDRLNAQDPVRDLIGGRPQPRELAYADALTRWVLRLDPSASEALRIAARGQHVQRWTIPRRQYPMTRAGYLRWRETLKAFHAETVAGLMREEQYSQTEINEVRRLMSKRELSSDPDTQTLEDALCLVFLETQFADLKRKTEPSKMEDVVRKTWNKMSVRAREEALGLPLSAVDRGFLLKSLEAQ